MHGVIYPPPGQNCYRGDPRWKRKVLVTQESRFPSFGCVRSRQDGHSTGPILLGPEDGKREESLRFQIRGTEGQIVTCLCPCVSFLHSVFLLSSKVTHSSGTPVAQELKGVCLSSSVGFLKEQVSVLCSVRSG